MVAFIANAERKGENGAAKNIPTKITLKITPGCDDETWFRRVHSE